MRKNSDRIRHSIFYEMVLLVLLIPLGAIFLEQSPSKIGVLGISLSLMAMVWNYLYNIGFDKILISLRRPLYPRGFGLRVTHALLFEGGLVFVTVPIMMWGLGVGLWQALAIDLGFLIFVPIYTLIYNWCYDLIFPLRPAVEIN
jgi:uncharacterized membrane protein